MGCPSEEVLADLIDGRLGPDSLGDLHQHVDGCAACSELMAALARRTAPATEPRSGQTIAQYRIERRLGRGGMGIVYSAMDTRLRRPVALKFVAPHLLGDARAMARLKREARTTSALDHPNLGQVYDIGEHGEVLFIAMPLYSGETLQARLLRGALEPRAAAELAAQIAGGLAAAHAAGVIHRDVKPSNIMLCADGRVRVLDFGLAKLTEPDTLASSTGNVVGTVAYMAPEQQAGGTVDARADVWSLGVTLYEAASARLPFPGANALEVMTAAATREPAPLGADPDLETIVLKCLEKDPSRRYADAGDVGSDLARYLAGEPVSARRAPLRRAVLRLKRRSAAILVALSTLVALGVAAYAWRARVRAANTQRDSVRMAGLAEQLRATLRTANLLPLHDTRPARDAVRGQVDALTRELPAMAPESRPAAHYAIGWGQLTLAEYDEARTHFVAAAASGDHRPELAYGLGYAGSMLYRAALDEARRISDEDKRKQREADAATELRDPALRDLAEARGASGVSPRAIEALIALDERRYDDARLRAHEAFTADPMDYDAGRLEILATLRLHIQQNETQKELTDLFRTVDAMYTRLFEIGRSDVMLYRAAADSMVELGVRMDDDAPWRRMLALCELVRRADSSDRRVDALEARAHLGVAELQYQHGNPIPELKRALAAIDRALAVDPRNLLALIHAGYVGNLTAMEEMRVGIDPQPALRKGIQCLEEAARIAPDDELYDRLGGAHLLTCDWRLSHGTDGRSECERAIDGFRRSIAIYPKSAAPHANIGTALNLLADDTWRHGGDPGHEIDAALEAFARGLAIERSSYGAGTRAASHVLRARQQLWGGIDARAAVAAAVDTASEGIALDPNEPDFHVYLAQSQALLGEQLLRDGADPSPAVTLGERHAREAIRLNPGHAAAHAVLSRLEVLKARRALAHGAAALTEAAREAERAVTTNPNSVDTRLAAADAHRWRAQLGEKRDEIAAGLEQISAALAIDSGDGNAHALRARLLALAGDATGSATEMARALQINRWLAKLP